MLQQGEMRQRTKGFVNNWYNIKANEHKDTLQ